MKFTSIALAVCAMLFLSGTFVTSFARQQPKASPTDDRVELKGEQAKELMAAWQRFLRSPQKDKPPVPKDVRRFTLQLYEENPGVYSVFLNLDGRQTERPYVAHNLTGKPTVEMPGDFMNALLVTWERISALKKIDHDITNYRFALIKEAKTIDVAGGHSRYSVYWPATASPASKVSSDSVFLVSDGASLAYKIDRQTNEADGPYILQ